MGYALYEYVVWQVIIFGFLIGWIWFVFTLGERKAERERKKRSY